MLILFRNPHFDLYKMLFMTEQFENLIAVFFNFLLMLFLPHDSLKTNHLILITCTKSLESRDSTRHAFIPSRDCSCNAVCATPVVTLAQAVLYLMAIKQVKVESTRWTDAVEAGKGVPSENIYWNSDTKENKKFV
jgi:hypothetical protein